MAPSFRRDGDRVVFVGGGPTIPDEVVSSTSRLGRSTCSRASSSLEFDGPRTCRCPRRSSSRPTAASTAFAHFYPPRTGHRRPRRRTATADRDRHGGPTAEAMPELDLGDAVLDEPWVRVRRRELRRQHRVRASVPPAASRPVGVVDTADCINAARVAGRRGPGRRGPPLITGGSAGGYTTLCALTLHDGFAAGASYFGLADLEPFAGGDTQVRVQVPRRWWVRGPRGGALPGRGHRSTPRTASPARCSCCRATRTRVVPPRAGGGHRRGAPDRGLPLRLSPVRGRAARVPEGRDHLASALEAELSFYAQVLGFEPATSAALAIENL